MKIKEFAHKYGIPYHIVYESTYKVPRIDREEFEYPEDKLFDAVNSIIKQRMEKHSNLFHQEQKMFINMNTIKRLEEL